jgi:ketosteroid isomerase-like protein
MSREDNVRFVRALWAAIAEGGLEAALEMTDPSVEWRPHAAGGRVLTSKELLRFFEEFQGERQLLEATPYAFYAHGDLVLASGSFRLVGRESMAEFQIHFVYEFEEGRLVRAASYATRKEALAAMGLGEGDKAPGGPNHD